MAKAMKAHQAALLPGTRVSIREDSKFFGQDKGAGTIVMGEDAIKARHTRALAHGWVGPVPDVIKEHVLFAELMGYYWVQFDSGYVNDYPEGDLDIL